MDACFMSTCLSVNWVPSIWVHIWLYFRDHFVYSPSQWEKRFQCSVVSHWPGAYITWSLIIHIILKKQTVSREQYTEDILSLFSGLFPVLLSVYLQGVSDIRLFVQHHQHIYVMSSANQERSGNSNKFSHATTRNSHFSGKWKRRDLHDNKIAHFHGFQSNCHTIIYHAL